MDSTTLVPGNGAAIKTDGARRLELMQTFGARYFEPGDQKVVFANKDNLYWYACYVGMHDIKVEEGDCLWWINAEKTACHMKRGPYSVKSAHFAVLMRGFMPEEKTTSIVQRTVLPYVNGCSTKQVFPPDRPGDPTLQLLDIPPHSSEQAHHIHSTVRCVYVLRGSGRSVVGMNKATIEEKLVPGKVVILEPMCPHHFETDDDHCVVVPFHVWSTTPGVENIHPMFNGTFMMNQGG